MLLKNVSIWSEKTPPPFFPFCQYLKFNSYSNIFYCMDKINFLILFVFIKEKLVKQSDGAILFNIKTLLKYFLGVIFLFITIH